MAAISLIDVAALDRATGRRSVVSIAAASLWRRRDFQQRLGVQNELSAAGAGGGL
jgi:hypothetical protein